MNEVANINNLAIMTDASFPPDSKFRITAPGGVCLAYCNTLERAKEVAQMCHMFSPRTKVIDLYKGAIYKEDTLSKALGKDNTEVYPVMCKQPDGTETFRALGSDLNDAFKEYFTEDLPFMDYYEKYSKDIKEKTGKHYKIYRKILAPIVDAFKTKYNVGNVSVRTNYNEAADEFQKAIILWMTSEAKNGRDINDLFAEVVELLKVNNYDVYHLIGTVDIEAIINAYNEAVEAEKRKAERAENPKKFMYLVFVDVSRNMNKYYKMLENDDGKTFTATWGRLGEANTNTATYPMEIWDQKCKDKWRKGYKDNTSLFKLDDESVDATDGVLMQNVDPSVIELMDILGASAKDVVKANYLYPIETISLESIKEAQDYLNKMSEVTEDVNYFNYLLLEVFKLIPRKMQDVGSNVASASYQFSSCLKREQDLLDTLISGIQSLDSKGKSSSYNTFANLGISIRPVDEKEEAHLHGYQDHDGYWHTSHALMGSSSSRYIRAWRVENFNTKKKFDDYRNSFKEKKEVMELFHGSLTCNFLSILKSGLLLRPTNVHITGKMFGYGIYFANDADKSMGYGSQSYGSRWAHGSEDKGYLAVFDVMTGNQYRPNSYGGSLSSMTYKELQNRKAGADCLFADHLNTGLRKDEIIIYKEEQATIKYLIEYS